MTLQERVDALTEAQQLIEQALELADEAMEADHRDPNYRAYLRQTFQTLLGNGNPYDQSIPKAIDALKNAPGDENDDYDPEEAEHQRLTELDQPTTSAHGYPHADDCDAS